MLLRLVLISLVLGSTILLGWLSDLDPTSASSIALYGIIAVTYLLTIIYATALRREVDTRLLGIYQIFGDLLTTSALVYVTGGAQSAFTFFFPLGIIGAAIIGGRNTALIVTGVSLALLVMICVLGWVGLLPVLDGQRLIASEQTGLQLTRSLAVNGAAIVAISLLAMNLGGQLEQTSASLENARVFAADLRALHQNIVSSLASGLLTYDPSGKILTANRAASELLQRPHGELLGLDIDAIFPDIQARIGPLDPSLLPQPLETVQSIDGVEKILSVSGSPLVSHKGELLGAVLNFQDVTDIREMEEEFRRTERLATVGQLAAGIAHEIRNPLASISGSVELLRASIPAQDDDAKALISIVTREIERLDSLISAVLDYSNPRESQLSAFDLVELTDETINVFRQDRSTDELTLDVRCNTTEPLVVWADSNELRQVLWNLLRNAAEAAAEGQKSVTVELSRRNSQAEVRVRDTGPGIPAADLRRIFDPFFTTKDRGTGLGLATVHALVNKHSGQIHVSSQVGEGTSFRVLLPLHQT